MSKGFEKIAAQILSCVKKYSDSKKHDILLWRNIDEFLEDMWKKFPHHKTLSEVILKITAVDRLYRAMLYRRRLSYRKIASNLIDSNIDELLQKMRGPLTLRNLPRVIEAGATVAGFGNPDKARYWVFASKYLHFHRRELFPLFDSNAKKTQGFM